MFQESELINLALGFISALIILFVFLKKKIPGLGFFYIGFLFIVCAHAFTVLEGVALEELFNILEHFSLALSGMSFAAGCWVIMKRLINSRDTGP